MSTSKNKLKYGMGLFSAISVLMGTVIGSGIFAVPDKIAASAGSIGPTILAWSIAGTGVVLYALVCAELSPAMPKAGGSYVYIDEVLDYCASFAYDWSMIFGLFLPVMAMMVSAFASSFVVLFPGPNLSVTDGHLVTATLILILAGVDLPRVENGSAVQNISIVAKIIVLVVASVGDLFALKPENFMTITTETVEWESSFTTAVPVLTVMGGYYAPSYMGGEIENPKHNLPLATIIDTGIVIITNILLTVACVGSIEFANLTDSMTLVGGTVQVTFGSSGTTLITLRAIVSIFGPTNGTLLSFPRMAYAVAENRIMFSFFSELHPKYKTPYITILVYATDAVMFIWTGNFMIFLMMSTPVGCLSEVAVCPSLFALHEGQPDTERPFKIWGYPVTAILATVIAMILTCSVSIQEAISGSLLMLTSIPAHFISLYARNRKRSSTANQ